MPSKSRPHAVATQRRSAPAPEPAIVRNVAEGLRRTRAPAASRGAGIRMLDLDCGAQLAAEVLPERDTVALIFRMLTGAADDPPRLAGLSSIVERTLSKGTRAHSGRGIADAFDRLGAQWTTVSGRQSTVLRIICLPEFVHACTQMAAELLTRPSFPADAVRVNVDHALLDLRHMQDDPQDVVRLMIQRLALGPVYGRHVGGAAGTLPRITRAAVLEHWRAHYAAGRMQISAAGPVDADALARDCERLFARFGDAGRAGRERVTPVFSPSRAHRAKKLKQQYIAMVLPGVERGDPREPAEQVLLGVLSGGMSGRLFTEVREKQGLVYWVGAWNENPRGCGVIHLGASTTPERCRTTHDTLLRELRRVGEDLTEEETGRAQNQLIAQMHTESDLTRARAANLSDDLFHFDAAIGAEARIEALRGVTRAHVLDYARSLDLSRMCTATIGPTRL
ncbi:MAG: insulinase family protein [Planctomycetia bacterium]|nr:MAG: insulinase family protein [Planctomycetia bacterium]